MKMKGALTGKSINILTLSDIEVSLLYNSQASERFPNIDLILGCGDLSYDYLEYLISRFDVPLYFVHGNHCKINESDSGTPITAPQGGVDLHRKVVNHRGLLLAGIDGCIRYRSGPYQYAQWEMWWLVFSLAPALLLNRILYGRYLDIFVTHAPPWGIHDASDLAHQGARAFRWFLRTFKPAFHFHGHIHVYRPDTITETLFVRTRVVNTFGYRQTVFEVPASRPPKTRKR